MSSVKSVLVVANLRKDGVKAILNNITSELDSRNITWMSVSPAYTQLGNSEVLSELSAQYRHRSYDLILSIGGDGTFLYTARTFLDFGIPILGINMGRLGFLMQVPPDGFKEALDRVMDNSVPVRTRMLLTATVTRNGRPCYCLPFLNDAVVSKGNLSRMVEMEISLGGSNLARYRADGLIVSTPTGSTAYNLSAGGPVLTPDLEAMVITPICPHSLGVRPIVCGRNSEVKIHMLSGEGGESLTIDGQENSFLLAEDTITIRPSERMVHVYDYGEGEFFSVLRQKLGWSV